MRSIKHCSGRLKKRLKRQGWGQVLTRTDETDGHRLLIRAGAIFARFAWFRRRWFNRGDRVTLRTAAIRAGLLPRSYCR